MRLVLLILLPWAAAWADSTFKFAPRSIPVTQSENADSPKLCNLARGERVSVLADDGVNAKVRVKRNGRAVIGYVRSELLVARLAPAPIPEHGWAIGAGAVHSQLTQNGKSFETEDDVRYTTSTYASTTMSPYMFAQFDRHDFWRVFVGYRTTQFKGSAKTDVVGAPAKAVDLRHKMVSLGFQRAWNPFTFFPPIYLGFGGEMAKATSMTLKLDSLELPTESKDLPLYLGAHGVAGMEFMFGRKLSLSLEVRAGSYLNQAVPVFEIEGAGLLFWWM